MFPSGGSITKARIIEREKHQKSNWFSDKTTKEKKTEKYFFVYFDTIELRSKWISFLPFGNNFNRNLTKTFYLYSFDSNMTRANVKIVDRKREKKSSNVRLAHFEIEKFKTSANKCTWCCARCVRITEKIEHRANKRSEERIECTNNIGIAVTDSNSFWPTYFPIFFFAI